MTKSESIWRRIPIVLGFTLALALIWYLLDLPGFGNADTLRRAASNMRALRSYHVELQATVDNAPKNVHGDFDATNNRGRFSTNLSGNETLIVSVGNQHYFSRDAGNTFVEDDSKHYYEEFLGEAENLLRFREMWNDSMISSIHSVGDVIPADDVIDGVATKHYIVDVKNAIAWDVSGWGRMNGKVEVWVDSTLLVRQIKAVSTSPPSFAIITVKWSNFNAALDIRPPTTAAMIFNTPTPNIVVAPSDGPNLALLKQAVKTMRAADSYHRNSTFIYLPPTTLITDTATVNAALANAGMSERFNENYQRGSMQEDMWDTDLASVSNDALRDGNPSRETIFGTATKHIATDFKALPYFAFGYAGKGEGIIEFWIADARQPFVRQMRITFNEGSRLTVHNFVWSYLNGNPPLPEPTP